MHDPFSNIFQVLWRDGSSGLVLLVVLLLAVFWIYQFVQLMTFRDQDFPGKHDKALWVAGLLVANLAGAIAFWSWKHFFRNPPTSAHRSADERPAFPADFDEPPRA